MGLMGQRVIVSSELSRVIVSLESSAHTHPTCYDNGTSYQWHGPKGRGRAVRDAGISHEIGDTQ